MTTIEEMTIKDYKETIEKLQQECKEKSNLIMAIGESLGQIRDEMTNFTDVVIKVSKVNYVNNLDMVDTLEGARLVYNSDYQVGPEVELKIKKVKDNAIIPKYQTAGASGMDLCAAIDNTIIIPPLARVFVPTGIAIELPVGYEAQVRPRSGLSSKHGITLINCVGTIDSDYRGEIIVPLVNISDTAYSIQPDERIAQMVISKYERVGIREVSNLSSTERGAGGFGSTGGI